MNTQWTNHEGSEILRRTSQYDQDPIYTVCSRYLSFDELAELHAAIGRAMAEAGREGQTHPALESDCPTCLDQAHVASGIAASPGAPTEATIAQGTLKTPVGGEIASKTPEHAKDDLRPAKLRYPNMLVKGRDYDVPRPLAEVNRDQPYIEMDKI